MNVISRPSVERLSANSDFDGKLVTSWSPGTSSELTTPPQGRSWSRKIRDVTPKLASARSLSNTVG